MSNRSDSTPNELATNIDGVPVLWSIIIVLGALLMAIGAVIALLHPAMLVSPHDEINGAVHIYAGYFASRNAALAIMLLALLVLRARIPLGKYSSPSFSSSTPLSIAPKAAGISSPVSSSSESSSPWAPPASPHTHSGSAKHGFSPASNE